MSKRQSKPKSDNTNNMKQIICIVLEDSIIRSDAELQCETRYSSVHSALFTNRIIRFLRSVPGCRIRRRHSSATDVICSMTTTSHEWAHM